MVHRLKPAYSTHRRPFNQHQQYYEYLSKCVQTAMTGLDAWKRLPEPEQLVTALVLNKPRWLEQLPCPIPHMMASVPLEWFTIASAAAQTIEAAKKLGTATETRQPVASDEPESDTPSDSAHRHPQTKAFLRLAEVCALTGLSRATIYRLEAAGEFSKRVRIAGRRVGWRTEELYVWIRSRAPKCP
jgi:predicted DNA-binding transcriptional regulator AlpA